MIKEIVFCDIDGTLKNSKGIVTDRNKQAINKLKKINVEFVLCSGRARGFVEEVANEVNAGNYIISSNGADVYDRKKNVEIFKHTIEPKIALKVLNYFNKLHTRILIKCGAKNYINTPFDVETPSPVISKAEFKKVALEGVVQINVMCDDKQTILKAIKKTNKFKQLEIPNKSKSLFDSSIKHGINEEYYIDVNAINSSKGEGIQKLVEHLNIPLEKTISIGDSGNDKSMFDKSAIDVAMGNSIPTLKEIADVVTNTNNNSGVAEFLEKHYNLK